MTHDQVPDPPAGLDRTVCLWCGAGEVEFSSPVWRKVALAHALTCKAHPLAGRIEEVQAELRRVRDLLSKTCQHPNVFHAVCNDCDERIR